MLVTTTRKRLVFQGMPGFGEAIRALREKREWSQEDLATRASTSVGTVSKLERNKHEPSRRTKRRFAEALGITIEAIEAEMAKDVISLELPREIYDGIAARAKHEGFPGVVEFLRKVATPKAKRVSRPLSPGGAPDEGRAPHAPLRS